MINNVDSIVCNVAAFGIGVIGLSLMYVWKGSPN